MCVILQLQKGQMPNKDRLFNAVYNNWHSYGLVTKVDGKLDIKRKVPSSGEVSPDEVYKLLEDDKNYERILHLRHNTAGKTDLANCHPFDIYFDPKTDNQVVFMHNGTFYEYRSKKVGPTGGTIDDDDGPSDTKNFVDQILIPYVSSMDFGSGKGDIHHPLFKTFLKKFWSGSNRGILISSKDKCLLIDDWKIEKDQNGTDFYASNDTYFDKLTRGPEFTRRESERLKKEEESRKSSTFRSTKNFAELKNYDFNKKHGFYDLSQSMCELVNDWELYNRDTAISIGLATKKELESLYADKETCLAVMEWIFSDYMQLYGEHIDEIKSLEEKKQKGEKIIATLKYELEQSKSSKKEKAA